MKTQGFNAHTKYRILQHALKGNNISKTCELFGISRTTFYNWKAAYQKFGIAGLENKEPKKPKMPNKVSKAIERDILAYVEKYPEDGPRRIYYELKSEGINVGETGIYNVLKRNNLSKKEQRIEYSKNRALSNRTNRSLNKKIPKFIDVEKRYPGYLVIQRIDFMGTFDGIGRIYQYCFYDTISKWAEVKLYNRKQDIDIWHYFEVKLVYLLDTFNLTIENLVTEREREFLPYFVKGDKHNSIIEEYNINHLFISPDETDIFNGIREFNEFLVKEFYNKILINEKLDSFIKVENRINSFMREYNFTNVISEGPNEGKTPAEAVLDRAIENGTDLDTLPLWLLALINSPRRGVKDE
ncbi:helix-turn-helix domain-containing protein [Tepidimicrobium xylanilyticum]|uniref:helix-turn-helix domain-containing protein n=1 Tax=Tepidimicrobium xylanilyticum TaxID=1123352 RepID=UPI00264FDB6C|nr:helix-turn-helix domain-containing protein [Tepidimicrobium xylanilyticum]GMG95953.1 integrase [Tepidimicrobium xylanilyticum]